MQALLLSAGLGTRLKPLTHYFPKCLTPIQGRPLLGIWLELLVAAGCKKILINLHYLPDCVRNFVADTPYADYVQWLYEPELLGTAGTVIRCRRKFNHEPLLLVHADNLCQFSLLSMWQAHLQAGAQIDMTMMTFTTDNPSSCGIIEQDNNGNIIGFHEKVVNPPGSCANAAVYILNKSMIDKLSDSMTDFSTEVIGIHLNRIQAWHNKCCHRDIGALESLLKAPADIVNPLTSPVTTYWYQYWCDKRWFRLHQVAQELAQELDMQIVALNEITSQLPAVLVVIEQFDADQWYDYAGLLHSSESIILIGQGQVDVIQEIFFNIPQRYILFVAT